MAASQCFGDGPSILYLLIVIGCLFASFNQSGASSYTEVSWQAPLQVFEYKAYRSVRILEYTVPLQTTRAEWFFSGRHSPEKCEDRTIIIALQHGSLPVISPLNETFPPKFNTHRTELQYLSVRSNDTVQAFQKEDILPGSWYAAVFLGDYVNKKISQKGFGSSCQYFLSSTHAVEALETVPELVMNVHIPLHATYHNQLHYRFHTTEQTWQYEINIFNCSFSNMLSNRTRHQTSSCPLLLASRGLALSRFNSNSNTVNCSSADTGSCKLTVTAPIANAWHYIMIASDLQGRVDFTVFIQVKECVRYQRAPSQPDDDTTDEAVSPDFNTTSNTTSNNTENHNSTSGYVEPTFVSFQVPSSPSSSSQSTITAFTASDVINGAIKQVGARSQLQEQNPFPADPDLGLLDSNDTVLNLRGFNICTRIPELGRYSRGTFDVRYSLRIARFLFPNQLRLPRDQPIVLAFDVKPVIDIGGTLKFIIEMAKNRLPNTTVVQVSIISCIQAHRIPLDEDGVSCAPDNMLVVNSSSDSSLLDYVYFPYPEPGTWYITLQSRCYTENNGTVQVVPCLSEHTVFRFLIAIAPCVDHVCGDYGFCREYFSGVLHFSACACTANWRGYGCTDGSVGESDALQLTATLMLTLSNLAFLPAIIVALYRRYFVEALVYTYTMFFSTFYHACDGDSRHIWCMMPYNVLAHCDFFGAILSFWVTLVAMARLPEGVRSFLLVLGALALAVGVQWDRHSLWTFLVPAATALAIMLISWCRRCYGRRHCYPTVRRWLLFILPGAIIAVAGLITFAFFETHRNYKYTHSVWHACIALCIVFILPPRQPHNRDDGSPTLCPLSYDTFETASILPKRALSNPTPDQPLDTSSR